MRDHRKLRAFALADEVVMDVYGMTREFPKDEIYGLTAQLRRGAISVASNIVEGCARATERDYLHFLDISYSALKELDYQLSVAARLDYAKNISLVRDKANEASRVLNGLIHSIRRKTAPPKS
jgi:four helix bundle protein